MKYRRLIVLLALPVLLLSCIFPIQASADTVLAPGYFNYFDYSEFALQDSTHVHVQTTFPRDWNGLTVKSAVGQPFYIQSGKSTHSMGIPASNPSLDFYFTPFGGNFAQDSGPGNSIPNFGLFDATYIEDPTFSYIFQFSVPRGFSPQGVNSYRLIVYFTDVNGRIVQVESFVPSLSQNGHIITLSGTCTLPYIGQREDVAGFAISFHFDNFAAVVPNNSDGTTSLLVSVDKLTFDFVISKAMYSLMVDSGLIEDSMDILVSGGKPGQDSADKFGDQADKQSSALNELIQQLSKGERPDLSVLSQYFSSLFGDFSVEGFNAALLRLWDNPFIFQLMVLSATLMLASYILYGKKV